MEERAIHISSINREKRGTSRPGDFTIKKFSFRIDRSPGTRWGLTLSSRLTALKLEASLFYQTRRCRFTWLWPYISCKWSDASDIYKFGEWSALSVNKEIFAKYF